MMFTETEILILDFMTAYEERLHLERELERELDRELEFELDEEDFITECDNWERENVACGLMYPTSFDIINVFENDILIQMIPSDMWSDIQTIDIVAQHAENQRISQEFKDAMDEDDELEKILPWDYTSEYEEWINELDRVF